MTPENRRHQPVEVLVDGAWVPGLLHHWRQREGRWEGWVHWTLRPGEVHIDWFDQDQLRQPPDSDR